MAFFPKVMNVSSTNTNTPYQQQSTSGGRGGVLTQPNHPHYHPQHQPLLQSHTTSPYFGVPGTSQPFVTHRGRGTFPVTTMPSRYYYTSPEGAIIQVLLRQVSTNEYKTNSISISFLFFLKITQQRIQSEEEEMKAIVNNTIIHLFI